MRVILFHYKELLKWKKWSIWRVLSSLLNLVRNSGTRRIIGGENTWSLKYVSYQRWDYYKPSGSYSDHEYILNRFSISKFPSWISEENLYDGRIMSNFQDELDTFSLDDRITHKFSPTFYNFLAIFRWRHNLITIILRSYIY